MITTGETAFNFTSGQFGSLLAAIAITGIIQSISEADKTAVVLVDDSTTSLSCTFLYNTPVSQDATNYVTVENTQNEQFFVGDHVIVFGYVGNYKIVGFVDGLKYSGASYYKDAFSYLSAFCYDPQGSNFYFIDAFHNQIKRARFNGDNYRAWTPVSDGYQSIKIDSIDYHRISFNKKTGRIWFVGEKNGATPRLFKGLEGSSNIVTALFSGIDIYDVHCCPIDGKIYVARDNAIYRYSEDEVLESSYGTHVPSWDSNYRSFIHDIGNLSHDCSAGDLYFFRRDDEKICKWDFGAATASEFTPSGLYTPAPLKQLEGFYVNPGDAKIYICDSSLSLKSTERDFGDTNIKTILNNSSIYSDVNRSFLLLGDEFYFSEMGQSQLGRCKKSKIY